MARSKECFHAGFNKIIYFFLSSNGIKTREAIINLACTRPIAPNSEQQT